MSTTTDKVLDPKFEAMAKDLYGYITRLWEAPEFRYRLYFTECGKARLASAASWLLGLYHGGREEEAFRLTQSLYRCLERLSGPEGEVEVAVKDELTVAVPHSLCVLGDDGCFNSFSFGMYYAIPPKRYQELILDAKEKLGNDCSYGDVKDEVHAKLKIREWVSGTNGEELTKHRYLSDYGQVMVRYGFAYNGGLIYHGPGAGETYTVCLTPEDGWGIHT